MADFPSSTGSAGPCPFCGNPLTQKRGKVNPYARCETEDCFGSRCPVVNLDDPRSVVTWNARAVGLAQTAPVPFAWVMPGSDTANDRGFIDALAWEEGEFTKPLYAAPQPASHAYSVKGCGEWRDIETAPQDGNPVIVWDDPVLGEAYFDTGEKSWWWANTGPGDYTAEAIYPTLWRPMPAAPSLPSTNRAPRHVDDPGLAHPDNSDSPAWAVPSTEENSRG